MDLTPLIIRNAVKYTGTATIKTEHCKQNRTLSKQISSKRSKQANNRTIEQCKQIISSFK